MDPPLTIARLPVEVKQAVLSHLPDLESLQNTALSCATFYDVFRSNHEQITRRVLLNYVNPDILHDAMAAQESAKVGKKNWTAETAVAFIDRYTDRHQAMLPSSWRFADVLPIAQFHGTIKSFTLAFQKYAAGNLPKISDKCDEDRLGGWELTQCELNRIQRALYRFEIYCNVFGDYDNRPFHPREQENVFFAHFSPWENEQLGCIHDYLDRGLVYPAYVYKVTHQSDWLDLFLRIGGGVEPEYVQHALSLGLVQIQRSALDQDLDHIPNSAFFTGHDIIMAGTFDFLDDALGSIEAGPNEPEHPRILKRTTSHDPSLYPALIQDPDPGPEKTWQWVFGAEWIEYATTFEEPFSFRQWGYVMWDQARLDRWGVFERSSEDVKALMPCPIHLREKYTFETEVWKAKDDMEREGRWKPKDSDYASPRYNLELEDFAPRLASNGRFGSWAEIVEEHSRRDARRNACRNSRR